MEDVQHDDDEENGVITYQGDDDSFEDADGKPVHDYLYDYISSRLSQGRTTFNQHGIEVPKYGSSMEEISQFYYANNQFIESKRDKYEAYNRRTFDKYGRDYVDRKGNAQMYPKMYGDRLLSHVRSLGSHDAKRKTNTVAVLAVDTKRLAPTERKRFIDNAVHTKKLRIEDVMYEKEIYENLRYHIRHQDKGLKCIAHDLFIMKHYNNMRVNSTNSNNANITSILASGVSGTGKTQLVDVMRSLYHMEKGGINEKCYVELRFGNVSDGSHRNKINGAGSGFVGSENKCLVDNLVQALHFISLKEAEGNTTQNVIFVFLDEVCKPKPEVEILSSLNSLLSNGRLERASSSDVKLQFVLPDDVVMIVYSTANYGAKQIMAKGLTPKYYKHAKELILQDMKHKKTKDEDISRLGLLVPFFALSDDQATDVLKFNIDCYFDDNHNQFPFTMESEDRARFISYFFEGNYVREQGLRTLCKMMEKELCNIIVRYKYEEITSDHVKPVLKFQTIKNNAFVSRLKEDDDTNYPGLTDALQDDTNEENLEECLEVDADIGMFLLCHEKLKVPSITIVPPQISLVCPEIDVPYIYDDYIAPETQSSKRSYNTNDESTKPNKRARIENSITTGEETISYDSYYDGDCDDNELIMCQGKCKAMKNQRLFIKTYKDRNGILKSTKMSKCSSCRK